MDWKFKTHHGHNENRNKDRLVYDRSMETDGPFVGGEYFKTTVTPSIFIYHYAEADNNYDMSSRLCLVIGYRDQDQTSICDHKKN